MSLFMCMYGRCNSVGVCVGEVGEGTVRVGRYH